MKNDPQGVGTLGGRVYDSITVNGNVTKKFCILIELEPSEEWREGTKLPPRDTWIANWFSRFFNKNVEQIAWNFCLFLLALGHALINTIHPRISGQWQSFLFCSFCQVWLVAVASCLFCIKRFVLLTKVLILWPTAATLPFFVNSKSELLNQPVNS